MNDTIDLDAVCGFCRTAARGHGRGASGGEAAAARIGEALAGLRHDIDRLDDENRRGLADLILLLGTPCATEKEWEAVNNLIEEASGKR